MNPSTGGSGGDSGGRTTFLQLIRHSSIETIHECYTEIAFFALKKGFALELEMWYVPPAPHAQ